MAHVNEKHDDASPITHPYLDQNPFNSTDRWGHRDLVIQLNGQNKYPRLDRSTIYEYLPHVKCTKQIRMVRLNKSIIVLASSRMMTLAPDLTTFAN